MIFDDVIAKIDRGQQGLNKGLPMGFDRLVKYIPGIQQGTYYLVGGETGCLAGDSEIIISRFLKNKGNSRVYTLKELYYKFNNKKIPRNVGDKRNGNMWDLSIPTKTLSYKSDENSIGYNNILNVIESGIKETFIVKTESGNEIRTTKDHRFLIDREDNYKRLEQLNIGDTIYSRSTASPKGRKKRKNRPEIITSMNYYPSANIKLVKCNKTGSTYAYRRIKKHRAYYDAYLNNVLLKDFIHQVKTNPNHGYIFSDTSKDIHHIDGNIYNNHFSNLQLLTKEEHARLHGKEDRHVHFGNREIIEDKIISIVSFGEEMTYDIEMEAPYNNFVSNGIVVHNSGKTAFTDNCFLYNPYDYIKSVHNTSGMKMKVIYWSFEIDKITKITKAICKKLYTDFGIVTDINFVLSRGKNRISQEVYDKVMTTRKYFEEMEDVMEIFDGAMNPTGINRYMLDYARQNGKYLMKEVDNGKGGKIEVFDKYIPNNPDLYTMIIIDHVSLTKKEQGMKTKEVVDKLSEYMIPLRNNFGFSPVIVQQIGRGNSSADRMKLDRLEPQLSDFKDSGNTQQDANVIMSLFDPKRYELENFRGYDINKLASRFRSLAILKNRDGESDKRIGLQFIGEVGQFKEIPPVTDFQTDPTLYQKYGQITNTYGTK